MDYFTDYNWTGLSVLKVERLHASEVGHVFKSNGRSAFCQLGIKLAGRTDITYNGVPIDYSEGHVVYLPKESDPNTLYERKIVTEGDSVSIFFDSLFELPKKPFSLSFSSCPQISEQALKIPRLWSQKSYLACMEAFYRLIRQISSLNPSCEAADRKKRIAPALEYIDKHIYDPVIAIDALAELCGLTSDYFKHRFKSVIGIPPLQYINNKKCRLAEELLIGGGKSIKEVAGAIGFTDLNYFARFFKQHTGLSPTEYRRLCSSKL